MEFWGFVGHNGAFAGADHIAGKAFGAFVKIDENFVEVGEGFELFVGSFVEGHWTIGDGVVVDNGEGEVEIVPETVGVVGDWVDMLSAVVV